MRKAHNTLPAAIAGALVVALAGCASARRSADRDLAAGRYVEAAAGYETVLDRHPGSADERVLFRLGLAASLADAEGVSKRGEEALHRLLSRFPQTRYRAEAELVLRLTGTLARVRSEVADARERLVEASAAEETAQRGQEQLRAKLTGCEAELTRVRTELEQLKRIDLQRHPHPPGGVME